MRKKKEEATKTTQYGKRFGHETERRSNKKQLNMGNVLVMKQVAMALFEAKTR